MIFNVDQASLLLQIWNPHIRVRNFSKKFIRASYHIEILCSNMRIEANGAIYDIKSTKCNFKSQGMRHDEKSKLVPQMRNAHIRACE